MKRQQKRRVFSILSEPATTPEFQFLTGYLVASELHSDNPELTFLETVTLTKRALCRLGEPLPTDDEIDGMRTYFNDSSLKTNTEENNMTDNNNTVSNASADSSIIEFLQQMMRDTTNEQIAALDEAGQREYGKRVAEGYIADPMFTDKTPDAILTDSRRLGINVTDAVEAGFREAYAERDADTEKLSA